jgi:hypothetical protein
MPRTTPLLLALLASLSPAAPLPAPAATTTAAAAAAAAKCTVKAGAATADLASALAWVCGAGGVSCGSHTAPTPADADFAFDAYYQAHKSDGLDTCFFGGDASLVPAPAGHYLFTKEGALSYPTPPKAGIGAWVAVAAGARHVFQSPKFSGAYLGAGTPTFFSLWVAGSDADQHMHVEIAYNLDGQANAERTEIYKPRGMGVIPQYQAYTNALGLTSSTGDFGPMADGTITVTVVSESAAGSFNFMLSTDAFPSFVTGPFG